MMEERKRGWEGQEEKEMMRMEEGESFGTRERKRKKDRNRERDRNREKER